jgi:hypothetical protein
MLTPMVFFMLLASFVATISISGDMQATSTETFSFSFYGLSIQSTFTSSGIFSMISLDGFQNDNKQGQPSLPCVTKAMALPLGKTIDAIVVTSHLKTSYLLAYPVLPEQELIPTSEDGENSFCYNASDYERTIEFSNLATTDLQYLRGYPILNIVMRPINYNPSGNTLFYYDEISITISYKDAPISPLFRNLEKDEGYLKNIIDNENDLEYEPLNYQNMYSDGICDPSEKYEYVIITSDSLNDTTGYDYNWSDLLNHRTIFSNMNCTKITVETINACPDYWNATPIFNDSQAHIREFCKDAYQDWETDYILLGGDWDGSNQIVPYRLFTDRFETDTYDTMPCDMYYSNLDGDWYYSNESIWGGGVDSGVNDKYSELFVGRITAYNGLTVSNAINKILWYDECNESSWLNKTSFWGGNLGWTVTSKDYMEELRLGTDTYRTFAGFEEWNDDNPVEKIDTTERLYHADLGSNYKTYFSNSVENDKFSIVNHIDHSSYSTPFGMNGWNVRYNTKPFFGYSQGCLAGRFSSGSSGCEMMMCGLEQSHAFALVLNTGYGYGDSENTDGPGQSLNCYFWDYFFNSTANNSNEWQIGKAQAYSKDEMSNMVDGTHHAWCYNWYSSHLFGDPAMTLKISEYSSPPINGTYPPWDINQDGKVDYLDMSMLVCHYGESGTPGWIPEDVNDDGKVNYLDISLVVVHYGESY